MNKQSCTSRFEMFFYIFSIIGGSLFLFLSAMYNAEDYVNKIGGESVRNAWYLGILWIVFGVVMLILVRRKTL